LWVIFALLDPDPDPHPQHCKKPWEMSICTFLFHRKKQIVGTLFVFLWNLIRIQEGKYGQKKEKREEIHDFLRSLMYFWRVGSFF
jgi:hypothetical protein